MILKLNHLKGDTAANTTQDVTAALYSLLQDGQVDQDQFSRLRVHLDWIQYKQNFRDIVMASPLESAAGENCSPFLDVYVDTRQIVPDGPPLREEIMRAIARANSNAASATADKAPRVDPPDPDRLVLEDF